EVAVMNGLAFEQPEDESLAPRIDAAVSVSNAAPDLCPGYASRCVFDIPAGAPTPIWLAERLRRCGVRPISLPVDIANYVMLEWGQPMHAFDYDKLTGALHVRRAEQGEYIATLDGREFNLNAGTLV